MNINYKILSLILATIVLAYSSLEELGYTKKISIKFRFIKIILVAISILTIPLMWNEHFDDLKSEHLNHDKIKNLENENILLVEKVENLKILNKESDYRISVLDKEKNILKAKVSIIDDTISTMSVEYKVHYFVNTDKTLTSNELLIGPETPYVFFHQAPKLYSSGLSFKFTQIGPREYIFSNKAEVKNGASPISELKKSLANVRYMSMIVPFLNGHQLAKQEESILIKDYEIQFYINGFKTKNIKKEFATFSTSIRNNFFKDHAGYWLDISHFFSKSLYDDLVINI